MAVSTADCDDFMLRSVVTARLHIPFFASPVKAGFPSPAESFLETVCDLNDLGVFLPTGQIYTLVN